MALDPDPQGGTKLLEYVGGSPAADEAFAKRKYDEAHALVVAYIGDAEVPAHVVAEAVLEVGAKLWARKDAPNAREQYGDGGAPPVVAPKDPMVTVYPTLDRWVIGGLG